MRARLVLTMGAVTLLAGPAGAARADATINGHNCAGAIVSSVAGPGFGAGVSAAAHAQLVDNFGFANCGAPPRQNP